jgi:hypothetical protein
VTHYLLAFAGDFGLINDFRHRFKDFKGPTTESKKIFSSANTHGERREVTDLNKIRAQIVKMQKELPQYKKNVSQLTVKRMKQEIADEALESKWNELNLGIDQWKHKYLYPFGQIAPIESSKAGSSTAAGSITNIGSVNQSHISTVSPPESISDHGLPVSIMFLDV